MYCSQNNGECQDCSLINYNRDCHNNSIAILDAESYCQCGYPIVYCETHRDNHYGSASARLQRQRDIDNDRIDQPVIDDFFRE